MSNEQQQAVRVKPKFYALLQEEGDSLDAHATLVEADTRKELAAKISQSGQKLVIAIRGKRLQARETRQVQLS